ncbi:MAG: hypothetical protein IKT22_05690 [Prevotella sp.]|nr:hypothetical protein [Prevotella sp.]
MKKILTLFALLVLTVTGAQAQTITATYGKGNGTFYNASGTAVSSGFDAKKFVSNTTPAVTVEADNATALNSGDAANTARLSISAGTITYTISVPDGYVIVSYQFEAKAVNNTHPAKTFTPEGGTATAIPQDQTWRTYKAENINAQSTYFELASTGWAPINTRNFTITVKPDEASSAEVTYVVKDGNGTTLFTSEPQAVVKGTTITTLPEEFQRAAFYTYNTVSETISDNTSVEFTATPKDNAPVQYTTDATDPIYYNLNIRSKYLVYNSTATGEVTLQTTSEAFNAAASWAFVGTPYDGFRVINKEKGTGYNLIYTSVVTGKNQNNNNIQFQTTADAGDKVWLIDTNPSGFVLRMKENTNIYFHHDNGKNFLRTCSVTEWSNVHNDEGSTLLAATDETALIDLYDALAAVPFGDGLNQYGSTDADFAQKLAAVKDDIDNKNLGSYATDYATLQDLQASLSLNLPQTGFYRIKGYSGNYMTFNAEGTNVAMAGTADDNNIVCYTPDKQLVFFVNGLGMYNTSEVGAPGATLNTYTFSEGAQKGHYYIVSNASSMGTYCFDNTANGTKVDRNSSPVTSGNYETDWTLEPVTELTITLNAVNGTYYRTFSAPVDIANITGATMNNVTVAPDNKTAETVAMTASNGLKAGNGVVLIGTSTTATATIGAAQASATTNLKPQYASEPASAHANHYFLGTKTSNSEKVVGFYLLKDTGKTGGFKAYIEKNASTAKEGFDLVFGNEVTGIDAIENAADNGAV